jgi:hypothetical protein
MDEHSFDAGNIREYSVFYHDITKGIFRDEDVRMACQFLNNYRHQCLNVPVNIEKDERWTNWIVRAAQLEQQGERIISNITVSGLTWYNIRTGKRGYIRITYPFN